MFKNIGTYFKKNKNVKILKKIDKYITHPKWIILQAVNFDEDVQDKITLSILVDKYNYQKIVDMIPEKKHVILVGNRNMISIMYRYCQSHNLYVYAYYTN